MKLVIGRNNPKYLGTYGEVVAHAQTETVLHCTVMQY